MPISHRTRASIGPACRTAKQLPPGAAARWLSGSAEIEAMVARTAPAMLELLQDGPRARSAIITALADRHPKEDVAAP